MTNTASQSPNPASLSLPALRSASPAPVTLLRVRGEDAFSYLQSQVSADLRTPGEHWVRYALWLDARGYVQADSFILRESAESFLLFSYHTSAPLLEEIVLSNVIADDVETESFGDEYCHWALWAVGAAALPEPSPSLPTAFPAPFPESLPVISLPDMLLFAGRNAGGENYDLLIPKGIPLPAFAAALPEVPWAEREARRIADGIPAIPADIGPGDLPQEGGDLPRTAVSTSKGCYLGQEVIARWHATGQVRSGLFRVRFLSEAPGISTSLAADLPLRLYAGNKPVGELRSFASATGDGLALLRIHRLGQARALAVQPGGQSVFTVAEPMLS